MVIKNSSIDYIGAKDLGSDGICTLHNCMIGTLDLVAVSDLNCQLTLEQCIISDLRIYACWFSNGLLMKNCIVLNDIDYQMGGHNLQPIRLEGNVFIGFFNFFDCQFEDLVVLRNNTFAKGANLLGDLDKGFANTFASGYIAENNTGRIDISEEEEFGE